MRSTARLAPQLRKRRIKDASVLRLAVSKCTANALQTASTAAQNAGAFLARTTHRTHKLKAKVIILIE